MDVLEGPLRSSSRRQVRIKIIYLGGDPFYFLFVAVWSILGVEFQCNP